MPRLLRSKYSARTERVEVASSGDQGHSNALLPEAAGARGHASQLPALVGLVVGIGALGRLAGLRRVRVEGPSMLPTLDEGERLLVRRVRRLRVGDLVVSRPPGEDDGPLVVKRVAHIDEEGVHLRGDNPGASTDSRHFGAVRRGDVLGVAFYRYAPSGRDSREDRGNGRALPKRSRSPRHYDPFAMRRLVVLSMHTSPLAQPGTGDGGGMNVYVRELSAALARAGVVCDVFTRSIDPSQPDVVEVEPGFRLHHVVAGPQAPLPKGALHAFVGSFTDAVEARLTANSADEADSPEAIHANYWLSGVAGHTLKHRLGLPLVSTFHTLDRVKAEASAEEIDPDDPERRARAESEIIGCSDAVLASCEAEASQLVELYGADRARIEIIAPGVDHAFFSPGDKAQARRAIGADDEGPLVLFVGRIQPLKGVDVAVRALAQVVDQSCRLLVIGGPSGPHGDDEVATVHALVERLGLSGRVVFLPPQRHEALSTFYRAADVCVVPSMSESFGLVALEAAACGTPVVASAVGGLTSLVDDALSGYLVEPRDVDGFARRLEALVSDDLGAAEMGLAGARRAAAYTWPAAAASLHRLYDEITTKQLVECS